MNVAQIKGNLKRVETYRKNEREMNCGQPIQTLPLAKEERIHSSANLVVICRPGTLLPALMLILHYFLGKPFELNAHYGINQDCIPA